LDFYDSFSTTPKPGDFSYVLAANLSLQAASFNILANLSRPML
jgi:hypothetical protein